MIRRSCLLVSSLVVASLVGLLGFSTADAAGGKGGRRPAARPRVSAMRRANPAPARRAPSTPRATNARANVARANTNNKAKSPAKAQANNANRSETNGTNSANSTKVATAATNPTNPYAYTYGQGKNARSYTAHNYGRGYRNRSYGRNSGYGRSQGNTRAVVSRLRAVHSSLARLDHDYQGHRARAMHSISMAVRQLTHRSMNSNAMGLAGSNNLNGNGNGTRANANGLNANNRANGFNANNGANGRNGMRMSQAQSDSRMSQAMRTLQGINMQLNGNGNSNGSTSGSHSRAQGHVVTAIHHLNTALSVR